MKQLRQHLRLLLLSVTFVTVLLGRSSVRSAVIAVQNAFPVPLPEELHPLQKHADGLKPLHLPKTAPGPDDWLSRFPEPGQSFAQYVHARDKQPVRASYQTVYVQPIGVLTERQQELVRRSSQFLSLYYGFPVKELPSVEMNESQIPVDAIRWQGPRGRQLDGDWINSNMLVPLRPDDAVAVIGLLADDLWCGDLNYVYGVAIPEERVGVWSFNRLGNPEGDENEARQCLWRTLHTAVHETGHILGFHHCTAYECCMNGAASREESDRQPLELCPECQAKVWWTCPREPAERWQELLLFAEANGLTRESRVWAQHLQLPRR